MSATATATAAAEEKLPPGCFITPSAVPPPGIELVEIEPSEPVLIASEKLKLKSNVTLLAATTRSVIPNGREPLEPKKNGRFVLVRFAVRNRGNEPLTGETVIDRFVLEAGNRFFARSRGRPAGPVFASLEGLSVPSDEVAPGEVRRFVAGYVLPKRLVRKKVRWVGLGTGAAIVVPGLD